LQLKPLYSVRFRYPADWAIELIGPAGKEEQHFFLAEGECSGTISGRFRGANHPRRRTDLTFVPDFQGVIETGDGAVVYFDYQGYGRAYPKGRRQIVTAAFHTTAHESTGGSTMSSASGAVRSGGRTNPPTRSSRSRLRL